MLYRLTYGHERAPSVEPPSKTGIALQVLALVSGSAGFIRSVHGWKTVCALIAVTSLHPEAAAVSMKALAAVARPSALSPVAFTPVLEAVVSCVERNAKVIILGPCLCP